MIYYSFGIVCLYLKSTITFYCRARSKLNLYSLKKVCYNYYDCYNYYYGYRLNIRSKTEKLKINNQNLLFLVFFVVAERNCCVAKDSFSASCDTFYFFAPNTSFRAEGVARKLVFRASKSSALSFNAFSGSL